MEAKERPRVRSSAREIRAVDLFCGCGGLTLGVREAARGLGCGFVSVFASDINAGALKLYERNFHPTYFDGRPIENVLDGELGQSLTVAEEDFVEKQIKAAFKGISAEDARLVTVAYEPIWAIGTGKTASPEQAEDMCRFIRETLSGIYCNEVSEEIVIQYGGSVKPSNASELMNMEDIDGALVGGASLKPADFLDIIRF